MQNRNTFVTNTLKRFGMGIAIAASTLVSNSQAQILYSIDDPAVITNSVTSKLSDSPIIQSIHRYALDNEGNLNGQITIEGARPTGLRVFLMQDKKLSRKPRHQKPASSRWPT